MATIDEIVIAIRGNNKPLIASFKQTVTAARKYGEQTGKAYHERVVRESKKTTKASQKAGKDGGHEFAKQFGQEVEKGSKKTTTQAKKDGKLFGQHFTDGADSELKGAFGGIGETLNTQAASLIPAAGAAGGAAGDALGKGVGDGFKGKSAALGLLGKAGLWGMLAAGAVGVLGAATGLGESIAESIQRGIQSGIAREDRKALIQATLGVTPEQAELAGSIAGKLYAEGYGESIDAVTEATKSVISSVPTLWEEGEEAISAAVSKALTIEKSFGIESAQSLNAISVALKNGLVPDLETGLDQLFRTLQSVPELLRDEIIDATEEYSPFFKMLGFDGEQAFGLLAAGAEKGKYGIDKMGDAIKEFSIRSQDGSTASLEAYAAMGLQGEAMATAFAQGGDAADAAFSQVIEGLRSIEDPAKQTQAAIALFGTPLEDLSIATPDFLDAIQKGSTGLKDWAGSAEAASDAILSTPGAQLEAFRRTLEQDFLGFFSEAMMPSIMVIVEGLRPLMQMLQDAAPIIAEAFERFAPKLAGFFEKLAVFFEKHGPLIMETIAILATWAIEFVGWLVEVVGGLFDNFASQVDVFFGFLDEVGQWLARIDRAFKEQDWGQLALEIVGGLNGLPGMLWNAGVDAIKGFINGFSSWSLWGLLKPFMGLVDGIKSFFRIASPSKTMRVIGEYVMQGFTQGIVRDGRKATMAAMSVADSVTSAFVYSSDSATVAAKARAASATSGATESKPTAASTGAGDSFYFSFGEKSADILDDIREALRLITAHKTLRGAAV